MILLLLLFISHKNAAQKNTHHTNTAFMRRAVCQR